MDENIELKKDAFKLITDLEESLTKSGISEDEIVLKNAAISVLKIYLGSDYIIAKHLVDSLKKFRTGNK